VRMEDIVVAGARDRQTTPLAGLASADANSGPFQAP